jgi:hypothetical protein
MQVLDDGHSLRIVKAYTGTVPAARESLFGSRRPQTHHSPCPYRWKPPTVQCAAIWKNIILFITTSERGMACVFSVCKTFVAERGWRTCHGRRFLRGRALNVLKSPLFAENCRNECRVQKRLLYVCSAKSGESFWHGNGSRDRDDESVKGMHLRSRYAAAASSAAGNWFLDLPFSRSAWLQIACEWHEHSNFVRAGDQLFSASLLKGPAHAGRQNALRTCSSREMMERACPREYASVRGLCGRRKSS